MWRWPGPSGHWGSSDPSHWAFPAQFLQLGAFADGVDIFWNGQWVCCSEENAFCGQHSLHFKLFLSPPSAWRKGCQCLATVKKCWNDIRTNRELFKDDENHTHGWTHAYHHSHQPTSIPVKQPARNGTPLQVFKYFTWCHESDLLLILHRTESVERFLKSVLTLRAVWWGLRRLWRHNYPFTSTAKTKTFEVQWRTLFDVFRVGWILPLIIIFC